MSGRGQWYRWNTKDRVESCRQIDVRRLHRALDLTRPGRGCTWTWRDRDGNEAASIGLDVLPGAIRLFYTSRPRGGDAQEVDYRVPLTWTPCHYGGARPWFRCPGQGCGRRVAILYSVGRYFLCRHCHDLCHASASEGPRDRLLRKAQNIRERLGGSGNVFEPLPDKPKGMHWETYARLAQEAMDAEARMWGMLKAWLDGLDRQNEKAMRAMEREMGE